MRSRPRRADRQVRRLDLTAVACRAKCGGAFCSDPAMFAVPMFANFSDEVWTMLDLLNDTVRFLLARLLFVCVA
jgi:hypothetical protein